MFYLELEHKQLMKQVKSLSINMPFKEAITQMPKYDMFLKDLIRNRKELEQASQVMINE